MILFGVNWLAVVLATVGSMALGMAWYMGLSKQWMAAVGKTAEQIRSGNTAAPFVISAICQLVMAYFIALLTPVMTGEMTWFTGLLVGAHMWLGFIITSMIINHRYQGAPWSLTVIDGGYMLGVMIVQGVIIGLFG